VNIKRDFNQESAAWDDAPGRVKMARDIAQAIIDTGILADDMEAMDFGCGTGLLTLTLQPLLKSITGVDSSTGMLEVLQQKISGQNLSNVSSSCLDVEQGDQLQGPFDLVVSSMTLHHIKDVKALLQQFNRVIRPGGLLAIADLDPDRGRFHGDNTGVFHFGFDRDEIKLLFAWAGFEVVEVKTAAEVSRGTMEAGETTFSIFLIVGRKKDR